MGHVSASTHALTVWEPYATLLMIGVKEFETRSWPASWAQVGKRIAIHAGRDKRDLALANEEPFRTALAGRSFHLGCVLGTVLLVESVRMDEAFIDGLTVRERAFGHFEPGRHAFRCADPRWLHQPKPFVGHQKFWPLDAAAVELSPVNPGQGTLL